MSTFKKILITGLIILLIYSNLAVMTSRKIIKASPINLPLHGFFYDMFVLFGMFSYYEGINKEVLLWGFTQGQNPNYWMRLEKDIFLPYKKGEQLSRAWAYKHQYIFGMASQQKAAALLAKKIRENYNRENSDYPISRVAIQYQTWPVSTDGFKKLKTKENTKIANIYIEP